MRERVRGYTIDPEGSLDLDDAIWVEREGDGWRVDVSIADVCATVAAGSELDRRAHELVATRYFADQTNDPMLPAELADDALSLHPDVPRETLTVTTHLDGDLSPREVVIRRTTLVSERRFTYEDATEATRDETDRHHDQLSAAAALACELLAARRKAGALAIYDLRRAVMTGETGRLMRLPASRCNIASLMIQEYMVLTNEMVGRFLAERELPTLYRNHKAAVTAPPREQLLQDLNDAVVHPEIFPFATLARKLSLMMKRATYGPHIEGHFGLNLPVYVHFTSPIRRYADVIVHRVLLAHLDGSPPPYSVDELDAMGAHINQIMKDRAHNERQRLDEDFLPETGGRLPVEADEASQVQAVREGGASLADMFGLLFASWRDLPPPPEPLRLAVMQRLLARPQEAIGVLQMVHQILGWDLPTYDIERSGPAHAPLFRVTATVVTPDGPLTVRAPASGSKKRGQQECAVLLLDKVCGMPRPAQSAASSPSSPVPHAREAASLASAVVPEPASPPRDSINHKGLLLEYCQKHGLAQPAFVCAQSGPPHQPVFDVTVELQAHGRKWTAGPCSAASRKQAEKVAAGALLALLPRAAPSSPTPRTAAPTAHPAIQVQSATDPVGALQALCQRNGLGLPRYIEGLQPGGYSVTCEITNLDGEVVVATCLRKTRAEARREAAAQVLDANPHLLRQSS